MSVLLLLLLVPVLEVREERLRDRDRPLLFDLSRMGSNPALRDVRLLLEELELEDRRRVVLLVPVLLLVVLVPVVLVPVVLVTVVSSGVLSSSGRITLWHSH